METGLSWINEIEWYVRLGRLVELAIAYGLALPIGWDRESATRNAGLRTFPLVAVASCGYMLLGSALVGDNPEALGRVLYGLMTGIGFIGGGAILKDKAGVTGTATAASIWTTGAIGGCVAFHYFEIAVALSVITFLTLRFVRPLKALARGPARPD